MATPRLFNPKKRKVFRKQIGMAERISSGLILLGLLIITIWVFLQRDNFDPRRQDISIEDLAQGSGTISLIHQPLKSWTPPGKRSATHSIDLNIFPQTVLSGEWTAKSRVRVFNPNNLFEKINGEAERFLKHGFQKLYYLVLQSSDQHAEISVELYDQGSTAGSSGVFSEHRSSQSQIKEENGSVFFETRIGLIGRKGHYFYRIAGNQSTTRIQEKSRQLVSSFASLPESKEKMSFGQRLLQKELKIPAAEIHHQSVNVFQYDFAADFWFGKPTVEQKSVLFIHHGKSPQSTSELYDRILKEHQSEYQIVRRSETLVLLQHNFLKTYFIMAKQGRFLFGVDKAQSPETSFRYLETIGRKLPHEKN